MRVVKEADERRNEILDAAERLFAKQGFDGTSTADILKEVGIARGTLYYHFKSKEDILDGMIQRMTQRMLAKASKIAVNHEIPVIMRITQTIMSLNLDNKLGDEIMAQVHRPQNALLHQKMQASLLEGVNPLITTLVEEAVREGICRTDYPAEAVEMMMMYSNAAFDDMMDYTPEERQKKVEGFIYNVERLLGTEQGDLYDAVMPIFANDL